MKVSTVEEMRELDRTAVEKYGIIEELLMENAGMAAYSVIRGTSEIEGRLFTVVCGSGNNGGDGFVVARKLHSMGAAVIVYMLGSADKLKGAAAKNYSILKTLPVEIKDFADGEQFRETISSSDCVIDAMFGTGLTRNVEGSYAQAIEVINNFACTVYSLDIPSGINGNTGAVMGIAVWADYTITFGLPKIGNILYPGWKYGGKLTVTHISFPFELYSQDTLQTEINTAVPLPERRPEGHKGSFGNALFIAGAANYYGAPYYSSYAFLKAGGGYSRLASTESVVRVVAGRASEIVFHPLEATGTGSLATKNSKVLTMLSSQVDFVVLGPGISLNDEAQKLTLELVQEIHKPLLVDGDGLTAVAKNPLIFQNRTEPTILTPHPGEMSRLSGYSVSEIQKNSVEIVRKEAERLQSIIVLKSAHTLIGYPDGRVYINLSGNSGMGTAGSGDVLTGTIAAMFGLGCTVEDAVKTGVFMHGFSGDLAAAEKGVDGITAQDILDYLPVAVSRYREDYCGLMANHYCCIEVV